MLPLRSEAHDVCHLRIVAGPSLKGEVMPEKESGHEDSPLWTSQATTAEPFAQLEEPENLDEIIKLVDQQAERDLARRTRPYDTTISQESLARPLK